MAIQKRGNGTYGVSVYDPLLGRKAPMTVKAADGQHHGQDERARRAS